MKRQNAQQLGILVQTQSEQIGRQHDGLVQEIAPLIQEVGRLLQEVEMLKKQIPEPKKEMPKEERLPTTETKSAPAKAEMQPQAPKQDKK